MKLIKLLKIGIAFICLIVLTACGSEKEDTKNTEKGEINLAYVEWDTEVASTHVVGQVLEDLGYKVTLTPLDNGIMWEALANGEVDGMVSAWLPQTHAPQVEKYNNKIENLGENLTGAKIGLVVPSYMDVDSIEDLTNQANQTITGIEPGANMMATTENAYKEYKNLEGWNVLTSSAGAMTAALSQAISNNEEIIITGWSPHWIFNAYDLKYLDDPKGLYGTEEYIGTFARNGLKEDAPEAYSVLDRFNWSAKDIESVMFDIMEGMSATDAAKKWIANNQEKVAEWTKDVQA
ncbi:MULTISPECIES: glycine betaine ABC transporter substrate-binding protein [Lysinibacillus]|uniref:glycine betaine ABC transporter substrate-binding protein n=1 Tax=Lysinibacillus TaxID=400634 RepID=UPI001C8B15FC|nr:MULTISPECIES: glycine betaine ABC transporter substrate-binding protein [Lysinibacillus]MBX8942826.1 glycine betaine ABC transporter substrate-binding protein [Lysinibacillus sp. K60]UNT54896.1 glycine betaine ABC transporter substrate-binding protein [Lysinibacillus capsici]UUV25223.1 glycine betaine ABC transporter substrate-binding protein [Lysinibacillus sp. FN11]UYB48094.1 glycine betaine ABC transporter substrate-binding protein [Lysinibacillus capsici]